MNEIVKFLNDAVGAVVGLGFAPLLTLALILVGLAWKKSKLPDKLIPLGLPVLGMVVYPAIAEHTGRNAVLGFVLGALSVWLHQSIRQLLQRAGLEDNSDPALFVKPLIEPKAEDRGPGRLP